MNFNWTNVKPACCAKWLVLPTVYSDELSYGEQLNNFCYRLNQVIENNNILPDFIAEMIKEYINSGAIGEVVRDILANYILNVKYPPDGITPAVGDGSADDTEAIQGCIDYAAKNGAVVYFPYGSYLSSSINMKNGVSLFGFDRYSTKIVLKGGANSALINGNAEGVSVINLTLDGNSGVQVNNVNVVTLTGKDVLLSGLLIKDGYSLVDFTGTGGHLQINNVVFGAAVEKCLVLNGNTDVQMENVLFNKISAVSGICVAEIGTSGGEYHFKSVATCDDCIIIKGNDNAIYAVVENATTPFVDNGLKNNVEIFGKSSKEFFSENVTKTIEGNVNNTVNGSVTEVFTGDVTKTVSGFSRETFEGEQFVNENNKTVENDGKLTETVNGEVNKNYKGGFTENVTGNKGVTVSEKFTTNAGSSVENVTTEKVVNAEDLTLNPTNPLGYKAPEELNKYFKYVEFKNGSVPYKVLVGTNKTDELNHSPFVNVQDFGAVGDGVTDDSAAFQSAIDTGFDVYVPLNKNQKYLIENTVTVNNDTQRVFSLPITPEFYKQQNSMIVIKADVGFKVTGYFNCFQNLIFVEDISPDSDDNKKRKAIYCSAEKVASWNIGGGECTITGCVFDRFSVAIHTNGRAYKIYNNEFAHCVTCIICDYTSEEGSGVQAPLYGFRAMRIYNNRMHGDTNCQFLLVNIGILRGAEISSNKVDVSGNLIKVNSGAGMCESLIKGNYCYGYCDFINVESTIEQAFLNNIISENSLINYFENPGTRYGIRAVQNSNFKGNVINSNVFVNYTNPVLFVGDLTDCVICGNVIIDYDSSSPVFRTYGSPSGVVVVGNYARCKRECVLFGGSTTYAIPNSTIYANNGSVSKLTNYTAGSNTFIQDRG